MKARRLGLNMGTDVICSGCGTSGSIREIVYGMPGPDFEFDKYIVGGCCVNDNDPNIGCKKCGWEGFNEDKYFLQYYPRLPSVDLNGPHDNKP